MTAPDGDRLPNYTGCDHPAGCQAPGEGCVGPCPVTPEEGMRIEREMYGDRLPATNSGQETCGDPAPQQPPTPLPLSAGACGTATRRAMEAARWTQQPPVSLSQQRRLDVQQPPAQEREAAWDKAFRFGLAFFGRRLESGLLTRSDLSDMLTNAYRLGREHAAPPSEADSAGEDGLRNRIEALMAKHHCSETSDGFGGYECGRCGDSWAHTLPGGEGCPTVRDLRDALAASPGVQGEDGEARATTESVGGLERAGDGATDVGAWERLAAVLAAVDNLAERGAMHLHEGQSGKWKKRLSETLRTRGETQLAAADQIRRTAQPVRDTGEGRR